MPVSQDPWDSFHKRGLLGRGGFGDVWLVWICAQTSSIACPLVLTDFPICANFLRDAVTESFCLFIFLFLVGRCLADKCMPPRLLVACMLLFFFLALSLCANATD